MSMKCYVGHTLCVSFIFDHIPTCLHISISQTSLWIYHIPSPDRSVFGGWCRGSDLIRVMKIGRDGNPVLSDTVDGQNSAPVDR